MGILEKLGFHKATEEERRISDRAQAIGYIVLSFLLLLTSGYFFLKGQKELASLLHSIFAVGLFSWATSHIYLSKKRKKE